MNFETKIKEIQHKYNLNSFSLEEELTLILRRIPAEAKVGIRGATNDAKKIISLIPNNIHIVGVFDNDYKLENKKILGYSIYHSNNIKNLKLNYIVIANYHHRKAMKEEALYYDRNIKLIDPYEEIKDRWQIDCGYISKHGDLRDGYLSYNAIYMYKGLYQKSNEREKKQKYLQRLISEYLSIRDFIHTYEFIKEYIYNKFDGYKIYEKLLIELYDLIDLLKNSLKEIQQGSASLFLLDALRYKEVFPYNNDINMPYLNHLGNESIVFLKAFSPSVHTRASVLSMLSAKNLIDGGLYSKDYIEVYESEWMFELLNEGYKVIVMLNVEKKLIEETENLKVKLNNFIPITKMLWKYVCELEKNKNEKVIILIHSVLEAHTPYICGFHTKKPVFYDQDVKEIKFNKEKIEERLFQCKESLKYLDLQLQFYLNLLPSEHIKVLFSDHGKNIEQFDENKGIIYNKYRYHDNEIHVPFIINSSKIKGFKYDSIFSMKNMGDFIIGILKNNIEIEKKDYVEIQLEPIYSKSLIDSCKTKEDKDLIGGYKVVRGEWDKYVLLANGIEKYHVLPDENNNLIDDKNYNDRINYLKSKLSTREFPTYNSLKFEYNQKFIKEDNR